MLKILMIPTMLLSMMFSCNAAPVPATKPPTGLVLTWQPSMTPDVTYNVYRAINPGPYSRLAAGLANLNYTDTTIKPNKTYCYYVTAFNGVESDRSNIFCRTIK